MGSCHYLNTDLEIESLDDLSPIVARFGEDVVLMYHGDAMGHRRASFEIAGLVADADAVIQHFCMLAEGLTEPERPIWDNCTKRVLDIGYSCGTSPGAFRSEIRTKTIKRVAALGASIIVTIYPQYADAKDKNTGGKS